MQIEQNGLSVAAVFSGSLSAGVQSIAWDGTSGRQRCLPARMSSP